MITPTKIHRIELQENLIKGYGRIQEEEYEALLLPTTKGLYGMNMIAMTDETLKDLVEMLNYSLGERNDR